MLATLMYHRISNTPFKHSAAAFEKHLQSLIERYNVVVPGEALLPNTLNICLTFDDAYYDFYHCVFPLLKKWKLRAVLAVPAGLILDNTTLDDKTRLTVSYENALKSHKTSATLCTWDEMNEMLQAKSVILAAHGLTHIPLRQEKSLWEREVIYPKILIKEKTGQEVDTFVYPYGGMSRGLNRFVNQHYQYTMRIGSALNINWKNLHHVNYRINAEEFWPQEEAMFSTSHKLRLGFRFLTNTLRFK